MKAYRAQVHTNLEIDDRMRALELVDASFIPAFDVLRVSLGIETEEPKMMWQSRAVPKKIGGR